MKHINQISIALIFMGVLVMSAGSASYGHIASHDQIVRDVKAFDIRTECEMHLDGVSDISVPKISLDDPNLEGTRSTSQAMAVGILFGARYASNPLKDDMHAQKVQDIKNYRTCVKEQALKG